MRWAIWASLPDLEPQTMFTMNTCRAKNRGVCPKDVHSNCSVFEGHCRPCAGSKSHSRGGGGGEGRGAKCVHVARGCSVTVQRVCGALGSFSHAPTLGLLSRYRRVWLGSLHPGLPQSHLPHVWGPRVHK
jgi:hypothetical protein